MEVEVELELHRLGRVGVGRVEAQEVSWNVVLPEDEEVDVIRVVERAREVGDVAVDGARRRVGGDQVIGSERRRVGGNVSPVLNKG